MRGARSELSRDLVGGKRRGKTWVRHEHHETALRRLKREVGMMLVSDHTRHTRCVWDDVTVGVPHSPGTMV